MKRILILFIALFICACENSIETEGLIYSEKDLEPLDSTELNKYYNDAAQIELGELCKDSIKMLNQVELDKNSILFYYTDLIYIYNNSYRVSNTFFEYATSVHSFGSSALFTITVSVDTNKEWTANWNNGMKFTEVLEIDAIISKYDLDINPLFGSDSVYYYEIYSDIPINKYALIELFRKTEEFINLETTVLIGGGSKITLTKENNIRYYRYSYGWGDCRSGCIYYHYWIVKVGDKKIELVEEGGDELGKTL